MAPLDLDFAPLGTFPNVVMRVFARPIPHMLASSPDLPKTGLPKG